MLKQRQGKTALPPLAALLLGLSMLGLGCPGGPASGTDTGAWTAVQAPIPHPLARVGHAMATYNGAGLLYGGLSPDPGGTGSIALSDLWIYKASAGAFARMNSTTPLPPPRYGHACTVQGVRLYAFFGHGAGGGLLSDVWYYDFPLTCWEPLAPVGVQPASRAEHSAVTVDEDFILVFGGRAEDGVTLLDDLWRYEPLTHRWAQKASFPGGGRSGHAAGFLGGRLYVLGGTSAAGAQNDVWAYDLGADAWSQLTSDGDVPGPFTGSAGAVGDFERNGFHQIMVAGGRDAGGADIGAAYTVSIDPDGHTAHWKQQAPHNAGFQCAATAVKPLSGPASASNFLLFGGALAGQPTDTGWIFSKAGAAAAGPDLIPGRVTVTAKPQGKGARRRWKLSGKAQVSNGGSKTAGATTLRLLLSADGSVHGGDRVLKQIKVRALAPGKGFSAKWSVKLPAGQTPSGRYVVAVADATGKVAETNEANNTRASAQIP